MKITTNLTSEPVVRAVIAGQIIVAPTDTIYGILARAKDAAAVGTLYRVRRRTPDKPCILLVASSADIPSLTIKQRHAYQDLSAERPTTIITKVPGNFLPHLPRRDGTLAFRVAPALSPLRELVDITGPLLAPSANLQGCPPAKTITEAIDYFGENVTIYVDGGEIVSAAPSRIVTFDGESLRILRD